MSVCLADPSPVGRATVLSFEGALDSLPLILLKKGALEEGPSAGGGDDVQLCREFQTEAGNSERVPSGVDSERPCSSDCQSLQSSFLMINCVYMYVQKVNAFPFIFLEKFFFI